MKRDCGIVRDLLPLYVEKMTGPESDDFVAAHLGECAACREAYGRLQAPDAVANPAEPAAGEGPKAEPREEIPLRRLRQKMRLRKLKTIGFTAFFVIALLVAAFSALDAPEYFPYSPELLTVEPGVDGITVRFSPKVTDYSCVAVSLLPDFEGVCYKLEAWTSAWDRWTSNRGEQATTIKARDKEITLVYVQNSGMQEDVVLYGRRDASGGHVVTLPRLALWFYVAVAFLALCVLGAAALLLRNRKQGKELATRAMLYPASYLLAHLLVKGTHTTSYFLQRDMAYIILVSLLLFGGSLLALEVWKSKREQDAPGGL